MHLLLVAVIVLAVVLCGEAQSADSQKDVLAGMYKARDYDFYRIVPDAVMGPGGSDVMHPGEKKTIAEIEGPGVITHIWFTLSRQRDYVLKDCVLRIWWDDEKEPSVEVPFGEFFGLGHGKYYSYHSLPFEVGNDRGYNIFLPMPFKKKARIEFANSPDHELRRLFYHINYIKPKQLDDNALYFHAQYRQAKPTSGDDYTILEAEGRGHFVGMFYYNRTNTGGWWGDGGETFMVDGRKVPGTGQEDYLGQGWSFRPGENGLRFGSPLYESATKGVHAENSFYRFHIEDPIPFKKSFLMTMRHGMENERSDDYSTVAFWYQAEPHKKFPELPSAEKRYPSKPDKEQPKHEEAQPSGGIPKESIEY